MVHGLSKIVYPVVINEFHTQCRQHILNAIRRDIFEQHCISPHYEDYDEHRERNKRMYLTQKQRHQLYSPQSEFKIFSPLPVVIVIHNKTVVFVCLLGISLNCGNYFFFSGSKPEVRKITSYD